MPTPTPTQTPAPTQTPTPTSTPAPAPDITGAWTGSDAASQDLWHLSINENGDGPSNSLTGALTIMSQTAPPATGVLAGSFITGNMVMLHVDFGADRASIAFSGALQADGRIVGSWSDAAASGAITLTRFAPGA
jgi:hypothetical protein